MSLFSQMPPSVHHHSVTVSTTARHSRTSCKRLPSAAKSRSSSTGGAGRCTRRRWRQRRSSGVGSGSPGPTPTRTTPSLAPAHWRRLVQLVQRRAPRCHRAPVQRRARRRTRCSSSSSSSASSAATPSHPNRPWRSAAKRSTASAPTAAGGAASPLWATGSCPNARLTARSESVEIQNLSRSRKYRTR